ncbi:response regulator transcription factor [Vibrio sp. TBV020]|uniref:helix-turn-helix transcriptional regulator n=1 Tax=Vibrio sp. TBV020 TaxID=3137398 RepID=UPI0038CD53A3
MLEQVPTSFEKLLIKQSNQLTLTEADKFRETFKVVALEALNFFKLDRLTLFPNSIISLKEGKSMTVSRPNVPELRFDKFAMGNYEEYLNILKVKRPWQVFDADMLRAHPLVPLRILYREGARWHGVIQLNLFGQTWGALAFSRFHEDSDPLSKADIERLKLLCDSWLCFWQHSLVTRSLSDQDTRLVDENEKLLMLSKKQCSVLTLLAQGYTAKQCAEKLFLSPRTIESHKYRMQNALGFSSHNELIQFALRNGFGVKDYG